MGLGGISIWQLLIVLVIIVLLFGTSKLRNLGGDVGAALKNFRDSMRSGEEEEAKPAEPGEPGRLPPNEAQKSASAETRAKERV
ncbi:MAG: twin-arginine translocase TatA/TatE family subunit [Gammaproteobacteria bacterium]|nr:twin-arginine translocase TatA/TatE family subunit [Gammaproteobacteria bacterium]